MSRGAAVVVGASRGIGLGLAKRLEQNGWNVYGTMRKAPQGAKPFANVIENVDVSTAACKETLQKGLTGVDKIGLLVYNAGIATLTENFALEKVSEVDVDDIARQIDINALGALRVVQALDDKLTDGSKCLFTSTRMASIGLADDGAMYGYRTSKTALNMIVKNISTEYTERGIAVTLAHPGVVKTDMTGHFEGGISVDTAVDGFIRVIDEMSLKTHNASLVDIATSETLPW
ncbi:3-oxoacyl-acyl-carrier-protein reductase [Hondaea fermentalgiana]|uniref:3-oxoacyl-acyl-carrier-protein reductase n=1 Tax=Hondaea fermentalgiana TaxID=2315210 RepID=A0A2R5GD85_9STRA|nr:3-oxoacyl-acyl-carrier-protein reductase [Hondaea fermentalgiana]|eukprot:GBG28897.1 3-oxoacyl-acyl-carrier-protein reductase [Hondaea fermentalgiana]